MYRDVTIITADDIAEWIHSKGLSIFDYLIKIFLALLVFYIISKILKKLISSIQRRLDKKGVDQIASHFVLNLLKYGILIFVIITIITQLNIVEVTSIAALIASAGVGISLAMQGALSNFAGGILLLIIRPFKKGDYIVVSSSGVEGEVQEIAIYYTTIINIYGEVVKIPNSQLTNNSVTNKSGNDMRILAVNVSVAYDTDISRARDIMLQLIADEPEVAEESARVCVDELESSGVRLTMLMKVPVSSYLNIKRNMNEKILIEFRRNGIEIPFNQMDVFIKNK